MLKSIRVMLLTGLVLLVQPTLPVIDTSNITRLTSVQTIPFEPENLVASGWFTLSADGESIAVVREDGGVMIYSSTTGAVVDEILLPRKEDLHATVLDAWLSADGGQVAVLYTDGTAFFVALHQVRGETELIELAASTGTPVADWVDSDTGSVWLEATPSVGTGKQVVRLPNSGEELLVMPSAPEADLDAFVRIGRHPAPQAVTASGDGLVKIWNLETGEVLYQAQLNTVPTFERINTTSKTRLPWRDLEAGTLNVLDFTTGENREVASLPDEAQALMMSASGDLVLGVHIGAEPVVVAWELATGKRLDLGTYHACERVPDMVRLSRSGTTLVIGCGEGLQVWRVV